MFFLVLTLLDLNAQSADVKAKLEYTDAEDAFQLKDYRKSLAHIEKTEQILGKGNIRTLYLKIQCLDMLFSENSEDYDIVDALRRSTTKYISEYSDKIDFEKLREVHLIRKKVEGFPATKAEYLQNIEAKENKEREAIEAKQKAFLNFKLFDEYEDGKDLKFFQNIDKSGSKGKWRDNELGIKIPYYTVPKFGSTWAPIIYFNNISNLSYKHGVDSNTFWENLGNEKSISEKRINFQKEMEDFSIKYNITPKIEEKENVLRYFFQHQNKTVNFVISFIIIENKSLLVYEGKFITNHDYEPNK